MDVAGDPRCVNARLKYLAGQIAVLVAQSGTTLTSLYGVRPLIAGRFLAEVGDITRFATEDKFASCTGGAPIDVSSGDQVRRQLSHAENRSGAATSAAGLCGAQEDGRDGVDGVELPGGAAHHQVIGQVVGQGQPAAVKA